MATYQTFFAANGFVNLGKMLTDEEVGRFLELFEEDRRRCPNFWRPYGYHQVANQIYYGHRHRPYLANDSAIPATLWRDHPDPETRAFYGVLNERTRLWLSAFPGKPDQ